MERGHGPQGQRSQRTLRLRGLWVLSFVIWLISPAGTLGETLGKEGEGIRMLRKCEIAEKCYFHPDKKCYLKELFI